METLTIYGAAANQGTMELENPDTNSQAIPQAGEWNGGAATRRWLIKFDLSSIPKGATITTATFSIKEINSDLADFARTMRAYRVKQTVVFDEVTWNSYSTGNAWSTAGCGDGTDRDTTEIGSHAFGDAPVVEYHEFTFTPSLVQGWVTGRLANNGIILIMDTETDDMHQFDPADGGDPSPKLVVTYSVPGFFAVL